MEDETGTKGWIDPWGDKAITDYEHLYTEFNISRIPQGMKDFFRDKTFLFERDLIIGHRDFDVIVEKIKKKEDFTIVSGFSSSGELHYGHKAVIDIYKFFRKFTKKGYFAICDMDAYVSRPDKKIPSLEVAQKYAVQNVADVLAMGIPKEDIRVQSNQAIGYYNFALQVSKKVTLNSMEAALGHTDLGKFTAAYLQIADILYPQIECGPVATLVPVGVDQEPLLRLTRDVARRFMSTYNFVIPSSIYTIHMPSLLDYNEKMSKSKEGSALMLDIPDKEFDRVIANAITGGKDTAEEQRKYGGNPNICPIYDLYKFNHADSEFVKDIYERCISGKLLCGEDKALLKGLLKEEIHKHIKSKKSFIGDATKIVLGER